MAPPAVFNPGYHWLPIIFRPCLDNLHWIPFPSFPAAILCIWNDLSIHVPSPFTYHVTRDYPLTWRRCYGQYVMRSGDMGVVVGEGEASIHNWLFLSALVVCLPSVYKVLQLCLNVYRQTAKICGVCGWTCRCGVFEEPSQPIHYVTEIFGWVGVG